MHNLFYSFFAYQINEVKVLPTHETLHNEVRQWDKQYICRLTVES